MSVIASLRPSRRTLWAGALGAGALSSGVALTATSGWLIVRASERPQILTLLTAIVAVRAFGMARPLLRYAERLVSHDDALAHLASVRSRAYAALIPLTPARLGRRSRADVLAGVVDDLTDVAEARARVTAPLLSAAGTGLLALIGTAFIDPRIALVLLAFVVAAGALSWAAWHAESTGQAQVLAARARTSQVADLVTREGDSLAAIGAQADALDWLTLAHSELGRAVARQSRGRAALTGALLALGAAATGASAWLAVGRHDGPTVALLVLVPVALIEAFGGLAEAVRSLARAQAAALRVDELLDQVPAVAPDPGQTLSICTTSRGTSEQLLVSRAPRLRLEGVQARWDERVALRQTDLTLEPGSRTMLVGANGCGKSTLLAVLARHLDPSQGRYLLDGVDARTLDLEQVRSLIAVLDDEPHIFASTLADNLRLARPEATDTDLMEALDQAQLAGWFDGLPDGLRTQLGETGLGVSGGERSRLGLARVLLSSRPIVLLDEPVAHLDHATAEAVLADVFAATNGRTVVMVSHRPEAPPQVHRILDLSPNHAQEIPGEHPQPPTW